MLRLAAYAPAMRIRMRCYGNGPDPECSETKLRCGFRRSPGPPLEGFELSISEWIFIGLRRKIRLN